MATKSKAKATKKTAVKAKAKVQVKAKAVKKSVKKAAAKPVAKKKTVAKIAAKKSPVKVVKKPVAKKAAPKKPVAKLVAKKPAPKAVMKPVAKAPVKPTVDTRHTLDRAPSMQNKAPISAVARPQNGRAAMAAYAPAPGNKRSFTVGEYVVYPTHGVGKIMGHEVEKIGDFELKVFVIAFEKDKMTLRVPVGRAEAAGLRSISSNDQINKALATLKTRAKIARGMWSRRAQEYEAKINSGNLVAIAEVVRDLHKNVDQSERSYSERMIYETALHRLSGEVAASNREDVKTAQDKLLVVLRKQAAMAA
jgi:CarD family transcriptional regulator